MPRERDYQAEYRRSNEIARAIGYNNAAERRAVHEASSPEELRERLEPIVQQRAAELDYQSLGQLYKDAYDTWDYEGIEFGDVWESMEY